VQFAQDWPYSSVHRAVRDGIYPVDWAGIALEEDAETWGE
jgi:putative transposase